MEAPSIRKPDQRLRLLEQLQDHHQLAHADQALALLAIPAVVTPKVRRFPGCH